MTKKEDVSKKKAGTPAAGRKKPETSAAGPQGTESNADDNQETTATTIDTVEDLEACYPQLVQAIRDEVVGQIGRCSAGQLKGHLPDLYQRVVTDIKIKSAPHLNVPGFLLEVDDPFAAGTLRAYQKEKRVGGLKLPYVLPYKDKVTRVALESYILRAAGGGDMERADAAREAVKKVK